MSNFAVLMAGNPTPDAVSSLFAAVLEQDRDTLQRIEQSAAEIKLENGQLVFSITGLHRFLDPQQTTPLRTFQQQLYASVLNRELRDQGVEIAIWHSTGKVATNRYFLKIL